MRQNFIFASQQHNQEPRQEDMADSQEPRRTTSAVVKPGVVLDKDGKPYVSGLSSI